MIRTETRRSPARAERGAPRYRRYTLLALLAVLGCSADADPVGPSVEAVSLGRTAFANECAPCHTARDGFDIAFFGFADADIVRRAVKHVDSTTAGNIVTYIRSLGIAPFGRDHAPFQPGATVVQGDHAFWQSLFGTDGWPDGLTPAALRQIDVRTTPIPIRLPLWSVEEGDTDWLSDRPLDPELLDGNGGALRAAIESFNVAPNTGTLLQAIDRFHQVVRGSPGDVCDGAPGAQPRGRDCFEALRWMSALAGVHILRGGPGANIPPEVLQLWWDTGEAARAVFHQEVAEHPFEIVSGWLYLAYSFAPTQFPDEGGYLEQFLWSRGLQRTATFTALRRMVAAEPIRDGQPAQRFADGYVAAIRGPMELRAEIVRFALEYLIDWMDAGATLTEEDRTEARIMVDNLRDAAVQLPPGLADADLLNTVEALRVQLLARI